MKIDIEHSTEKIREHIIALKNLRYHLDLGLDDIRRMPDNQKISPNGPNDISKGMSILKNGIQEELSFLEKLDKVNRDD